MELHITDKEKLIDLHFGVWLRDKIRLRLVSSYTKYHFDNWNKWLNDSEDIKKLYNKKYSVLDIILFASKNIICNGVDGDLHIYFNNNIFVPGFDRLKLNTCIKTINFGTLDIKGCPIFTDTLDEFANNIDTYLSVFYRL